MTTSFRVTRRSLIAATAAAPVFSILPRRASAAAEFQYKLGHSSPETHPFHIRLLEVSARIAKESGGRMTLTIFPNSQLGGDNDLLSQARSGAVEFAQPAGLILASVLPVTAVNGMGFAFPDYATVWKAIDGELGDYLNAQVRQKTNLVPMKKRWDLGFRHTCNSVRPINTPADMAGLKFRVPGAPALLSLFKDLGTYPVAMQFSEIYTSLQTKVVDGVEDPLSVLDAGKFYEVQKYCALTNHCWDGYFIVANGDAWNALPDDLKQVTETAFDETAPLERADCAKLDSELQGQLEAKGMAFTKPDLAAFKEKLVQSGYYQEWRKNIGDTAWELMEKYTGKLG